MEYLIFFLFFKQPPVAGSINWARCLFSRLKRTMQKFETVGNDMMRDPAAQEVSNRHSMICFFSPFYLAKFDGIVFCKIFILFTNFTYHVLNLSFQMNIYYCALAKQMLSFEKQWAGQWSQSVSQQAVNYLKQVSFYIRFQKYNV